MTKWLAMLVSCLALGLAIAACGDDEEDSGGGAADTESPAQQGGSQESASPAKKVEVAIKDFSFKPQSLEIAKGTTVTWTNEDSAGHDVTKTGGPGPEFSSGEAGGLEKGDTYKKTFTAAGEIEYVCTVHPNMKANLTVK
jgi:plastocyanin